MNYYSLMPSLQRTACIKIAIALWNQDDIDGLTEGFDYLYMNTTERQKWLVIEGKLTIKIKELPLPDLLRKKVSSFIKPIGFEILKWRDYHQRFCQGRNFLNKLYWTAQGTVDRKKTAEALVRDENLAIRKRYRLACIYCLKDDILTLWNNMSEYYKQAFYSKHRTDLEEDTIVSFWTYNLKRNVTRIECMGGLGNHIRCTPLQYTFEYAAFHGNKVATEYFWKHLNCVEREKSLSFYARYLIGSRCSNLFPFANDSAGVLFFLLSQMNEEQQLGVFKEHPCYVLKSLLKWPWQDFFMETVNHMWAFLPEDDFHSILEEIMHHVMVGFNDYNYQKLFREFWQKSPTTYKEYVIHDCNDRPLLLDLFHMKDMENIKIILDSVTVLDREELIFSDKGKTICEDLIIGAEMDLLEFFVQECISSKDVMIKFKEDFEKYIMYCLLGELLKDEKDWIFIGNKMFPLLNDLIQKYDKRRCVEEGYNGPVKRLCS